MSRNVSDSTKKLVAGKQRYKCANKPGNNLKGLDGYNCVLWNKSDGSFDQAGYEIDHITELSISNNNSIENLQALCVSCHRVKTKYFLRDKSKKLHTINDNDDSNDDSTDDTMNTDEHISCSIDDNVDINDIDCYDTNHNDSDNENSDDSDDSDNENSDENIKIFKLLACFTKVEHRLFANILL